jgi:hypothetical protein
MRSVSPITASLTRRPTREPCFERDVGPSEWLMVDADFEQNSPRIVTALGYGHGLSPIE